MEVFASYCTDAGNVKDVNQDSLSVKIVNSPQGKIVFAVVCDGMGGLEQGEVASKEVVLAMNEWFHTGFAHMVATDSVDEDDIYEQWHQQIDAVNQKIIRYSERTGLNMGTTLTALLIYGDQYYVCNVGDSRLYRIEKQLQRVTVDQTVVAQEVRMGILTEEEAENDPRRNILLQCVGASAVVEPQFDSGFVGDLATFVLCSDGLIHKITADEIYNQFRPEVLIDKEAVENACTSLTSIAMERGEKDNITVIGIVVRK